jgi:hypothetical protein
MASVFNEVVLGWGGKEYRVTPDMRLLNRIENDVSLSRLAYRMGQGDVPVSQLAMVVATMLRHAGADASDEAVYQEIMTGDADAVQQMAGSVMQAVFPTPKKSSE